jgi:hypothetical protein
LTTAKEERKYIKERDTLTEQETLGYLVSMWYEHEYLYKHLWVSSLEFYEHGNPIGGYKLSTKMMRQADLKQEVSEILLDLWSLRL